MIAVAGLGPVQCAACGRQAGLSGVFIATTGHPDRGGQVLMMCGREACFKAARNGAAMADEAYSAAELKAIERGGAAAGAYLDALGKYALDELSPDEWRAFCTRMIEGFGAALRDELAQGAPPF